MFYGIGFLNNVTDAHIMLYFYGEWELEILIGVVIGYNS